MMGDAELFRGWANPSYNVAESRSVIYRLHLRNTGKGPSVPPQYLASRFQQFGRVDKLHNIGAFEFLPGTRVQFPWDDDQERNLIGLTDVEDVLGLRFVADRCVDLVQVADRGCRLSTLRSADGCAVRGYRARLRWESCRIRRRPGS